MIRYRSIGFSILLVSTLTIMLPSHMDGQASSGSPPTAADAAQSTASQQALPDSPQPQNEREDQELKDEEHQRTWHLFPNYTVCNDLNAPPLTAGQKFSLAFRSAVDPYQFIAAAADAGIGQAEDSFHGYGQGAEGYGKRYGAAFADQASGRFWGIGVFPVLLHEDPRYFRMGSGSFKKRFLHAISSTVWSRRDDGTWGVNYSNVMGNIAAGGLSNAYYPSSDRGAGLTFERAFTGVAIGTVGAVLSEFGPDATRRFLHRHRSQAGPEPGGTAEPAPN